MEFNQDKKRSFVKVDKDIRHYIPCLYARAVFINLCEHRNRVTGLCCPNEIDIAKEELMSVWKVKKCIKLLASLKIITITKQWKSNGYVIHDKDISYLSGVCDTLDTNLSGVCDTLDNNLSGVCDTLDQVCDTPPNNINSKEMNKKEKEIYFVYEDKEKICSNPDDLIPVQIDCEQINPSSSEAIVYVHEDKRYNAATKNEIIKLFNEKLGDDLQKIRFLNSRREVVIKARIKDLPTMGDWEELFETVKQSDFLCGRNDRWMATFDWIIKESNTIKILEGNYKNRSAETNDFSTRPTKAQERHNAKSKFLRESLEESIRNLGGEM